MLFFSIGFSVVLGYILVWSLHSLLALARILNPIIQESVSAALSNFMFLFLHQAPSESNPLCIPSGFHSVCWRSLASPMGIVLFLPWQAQHSHSWVMRQLIQYRPIGQDPELGVDSEGEGAL